jgi:hypothetical protein
MCSPSIWMTSRSSLERFEAIHSAMRSADSATNRREAADFDVPSPRTVGRSPSGSRTARLSLRVDTLISIRFMAQRPSQSSAWAALQLGSAISWPPLRTRGRRTSTLPPWKPILPFVVPQRWPTRSPRLWRAPASRCASSHSICSIAPMPAVRQNRSNELSTSCQAASRLDTGVIAEVVVEFLMALLSSRIRHPEPNGSRRATPALLLQHRSGHSRFIGRWFINEFGP